MVTCAKFTQQAEDKVVFISKRMHVNTVTVTLAFSLDH